MENNEIMVANQNLYVSPVVGIEEAKSKFDLVRQYTAKCLTKDIDYGKVAGVSKPSLLKPGAEKICSLFGLTPKFSCVDKIMNWNGEGNPDNEPFFYFEYRCDLYRGGEFVASCDGSCNSWEKKYRYRKGGLVCPDCGKQTLMKSKYDAGYYCNAKSGGCGHKFQANDTRIANQSVGDQKNFDTAEQVNTYQKMAQKRAYVGATLIACNLSEYYTQDVEDLSRSSVLPEHEYTEAEFIPVEPEPQKPVQQPVQQQFDEVEFLKKWTKPSDVSAMSRTNAESMIDDKGTPYGEKDTKSLWFMQRAISKKLADPETPNDMKDLYAMKLSAVCEILHCRKMEKTLPEQNSATSYEA